MKKGELKIGWIFIIMLCFLTTVFSQNYLEREDRWVRKQIANMTLDQKIGQLFMVRVNSRGNIQEEKIILDYIKNYHIGGVCFFQGSPTQQARLVNKLQGQSAIPLFVGMDAEWGLGMRFPKEAISFPIS